MVKLNKIYTKTGDDGSTGLVNGERVPKSNLRVRAFGDVDETNSVIGIARLHLDNTKIDKMLSRIQNDLFDLGADLATPITSEDNKIDLRINASQTLRLEKEMDKLNLDLLPLSSFILPGGAAPSAYLHQARTVCRRAERICVAL
ncbi:MAG: cob(I)yrinic acid a,c-diamide adenosyltransferase, partial [Hellea sp.]|nr:cob(I)yrinic acid a,c-diamide adenosyltransferase [Hellea sp.]